MTEKPKAPENTFSRGSNSSKWLEKKRWWHIIPAQNLETFKSRSVDSAGCDANEIHANRFLHQGDFYGSVSLSETIV